VELRIAYAARQSRSIFNGSTGGCFVSAVRNNKSDSYDFDDCQTSERTGKQAEAVVTISFIIVFTFAFDSIMSVFSSSKVKVWS
jgi:hypothetical protein